MNTGSDGVLRRTGDSIDHVTGYRRGFVDIGERDVTAGGIDEGIDGLLYIDTLSCDIRSDVGHLVLRDERLDVVVAKLVRTCFTTHHDTCRLTGDAGCADTDVQDAIVTDDFVLAIACEDTGTTNAADDVTADDSTLVVVALETRVAIDGEIVVEQRSHTERDDTVAEAADVIVNELVVVVRQGVEAERVVTLIARSDGTSNDTCGITLGTTRELTYVGLEGEVRSQVPHNGNRGSVACRRLREVLDQTVLDGDV